MMNSNGCWNSSFSIHHSSFPSVDRTKRRSLFLPLVFHQGVDHRLQVAGDNAVEFVNREVDAMVGQAIVGKL